MIRPDIQRRLVYRSPPSFFKRCAFIAIYGTFQKSSSFDHSFGIASTRRERAIPKAQKRKLKYAHGVFF